MTYAVRLKELYNTKLKLDLKKDLAAANEFEVPKLEKVVINVGFSREDMENKDIIGQIESDLATITGQKPVKTVARKSIAAFKVREGMHMGFKITLRGDKMYEFVDRLFNIALPRVRDFRGVPTKSFDKSGNYTFGIKEHTIFPELNVDKIKRVTGMDISFISTAKNSEQAKALLIALGMPFKK